MDLADAFVDEARWRKNNAWYQELGRVSKLAMQPWDLGNITVYIDDGQGSVRTVWFEFTGLPNYPFGFKYDHWDAMQAFDAEAFFLDSIRQPLFEHIRYRPALPVDDHIILGED